MLDKVLAGVRRNPADHEKLDAYILLLAQQNDKKEQAEGLAELAGILTNVNPLRALECIEIAFRLKPESAAVVENLAMLLEARGDVISRDKVRSYLKTLNDRRLPEVRLTDRDSVNEGTRIGPVLDAETPAVPARAGAAEVTKFSHSPNDETNVNAKIEDDVTVQDDGPSFENERNTATNASSIVKAKPAKIVTPPAAPSSKTLRGDGRYGIFKALVKDVGLPVRLLEHADEFSDSLVGLVHFLHYLYFSKQVDNESFRVANDLLQSTIRERPEDLKAQIRYAELIKPLIS